MDILKQHEDMRFFPKNTTSMRALADFQFSFHLWFLVPFLGVGLFWSLVLAIVRYFKTTGAKTDYFGVHLNATP